MRSSSRSVSRSRLPSRSPAPNRRHNPFRPSRSLQPEPERQSPSPRPSRCQRQQPAHAGPAGPIPSISEVLSRIEHLRQERQFARPQPQPQAAAAPRSVADGPSPLFRWECGPSGEIAWVEGVPRGPLIGRSLANPGEHNGVDQRIQRAFAVRAPFRDAALTVSGEGPAAGEWKLSGVPAFEPSDGRFAGYRGVAMRSSMEETEVSTPAEEEPLDEAALRELIHELRTPSHRNHRVRRDHRWAISRARRPQLSRARRGNRRPGAAASFGDRGSRYRGTAAVFTGCTGRLDRSQPAAVGACAGAQGPRHLSRRAGSTSYLRAARRSAASTASSSSGSCGASARR